MNKKSPYQHGGNPANDLARLNLPAKPVLDFSVNLNPFGIPPIIKEKWADFLQSIENYPSVEGDGISQYFREKYKLSPKNILAGNGSTELIYLVPRVLGLKRVLIITPSYHDYERASIMAGAKVEKFSLQPDEGFASFNVDKLTDSLEKADALWLGRPNNPTGTLFSKEIILDLAERFPEKWFIIDEAFIQFVDAWKEESFVTEQLKTNIVVIHSLTKFYAIAGLRMGGVVGAEALISRLREAKEPWSVNGIADRIAPLLLECTRYEEESRLEVSRERERIFNRLTELKSVIPFSSTTDFILCQWVKTENLDDLIQHLLENGIYIRDCRNFPGLTDNYFRIGLRSAGENDRLVQAVRDFG